MLKTKKEKKSNIKKTKPFVSKKTNSKLKAKQKTTLKTSIKAKPTVKKINTSYKKKIMELKKELENINKKNKEKVLIKDAEGRLYCQNENCDRPTVTDNFCRYHYLAKWPYIYARKNLLKENYLAKKIQKLFDTFGESALSFLLQDCKNEKTFKQAVSQMLLQTNEEDSLHQTDTDY